MEIKGARTNSIYMGFRGRGGNKAGGFNLQIIMFNKESPY
jgi:hypothetical protein